MSAPLWRWRELCAALALPELDGPDVSGVEIDSRKVSAGDLFVALTGDPGPRFNPSQRSDRDGHDFIDAALAAGAVGVLSHDPIRRACPELKVADTLDGLWALGRAGRGRLTGPVVGITGSSGKTTCKTLLTSALGAFSTAGSLNNHLGVPLSLARAPRDAPAAVIEIGTNHPGEIGPLAELAAPTVAVLLNVHPAHAGNFPDMDALRDEKLSITRGLTPGAWFVVEDRVEVPRGIQDRFRVLRFGRTAAADVRLVRLVGGDAEYAVRGSVVRAVVPGGGAHRALSLAAVLGVLVALEQPLEPALGLTDELVPAGRGNRLQVNGITLIDDSYNANPGSMRAALEALAAEPGRRLALLGEMLELGARADAEHRGLADACGALDGLICVGAGTRALAEAVSCPLIARVEAADDALLERLCRLLAPGDTLLIKGSNRVFWQSGFVGRLAERLRLTSD